MNGTFAHALCLVFLLALASTTIPFVQAAIYARRAWKWIMITIGVIGLFAGYYIIPFEDDADH